MSVQPLVEHAGLGASDRLHALRARGARLRDDVEVAVAPVRGHLTAAARLVVREPTPARNISSGVIAEREAQRAVAIVRVEPVVAGAKRQAGRDQDGFVARAADLEIDAGSGS